LISAFNIRQPEGVDHCLLLRLTVTDRKKRRVAASAAVNAEFTGAKANRRVESNAHHSSELLALVISFGRESLNDAPLRKSVRR